MPQISIIVPVYKVEKYINRCIDSILTQTFTDFELILVDDGSPDNCPAICDRYVSKDNRVKVIHKKNGGVSSARNSALDIAQGEYITFVDADDLLEQNALYALLDGMKSLENGLVIGGIVSETIDRTQKRYLFAVISIHLNTTKCGTEIICLVHGEKCFHGKSLKNNIFDLIPDL